MTRAIIPFLRLTSVAALSAACLLSLSSRALACGGFFCSQSAPVNQAAERIVFAENGDGTVTAVIQILYEGPAESFSWLLPISTVPRGNEDIGIASNLAFARLQGATNPQYNLTTRIEGTCRGGSIFANTPSAGGPGRGVVDNESSGPGGVTVEASGVVGAFEWTVISLGADLDDPAATAVEWLETNGYDVAEGARGLIGPYLKDGLYLLALRLTKGSDTGSIRPIALTYAADQPMIPIKLTAVAANEDMGVMTWLLSAARGVPQNYLSLELNEAKINWFNAGSTYDEVVTDAADEAGGRGFVTEFAGTSSTLSEAVWSSSDQALWQSFSSTTFSSFSDIFNQSNDSWGSWDGFWDAVRSTVTLPSGLSFEDFKFCPSCYATEIEFSPLAYVQALESNVIEPVRMVQDLIDSRPYVTRLYTTMSAAEMTEDPLFTFNPDLDDVSNIHSAERVIECSADVDFSEAPWRIELPQGTVVRGNGQNVQQATWPAAEVDQPSNARILRLSSSGPGVVLEDNGDRINSAVDRANERFPRASGGGCSFSGSQGAPWLLLLGAFSALALSARRSRRRSA